MCGIHINGNCLKVEFVVVGFLFCLLLGLFVFVFEVGDGAEPM